MGRMGREDHIAIQVEPRMPEPMAGTAAADTASASPSIRWQPAAKRICSAEDLKRFLASDTLKSFLAFVNFLNQSVQGQKASTPCEASETVSKLQEVLSSLAKWVDEIPPSQQSLRYGNPAYRTWFMRMAENTVSLLQSVLPKHLRGAALEIAPYFLDSFGNATRIDYGTGHETNFCALLYCLARLGVFREQDGPALVLQIFKQYIQLMRKIQTTYWLEPAGSHGVWGLDDYQFLPFVWGSAQLAAHPMIKPKSIHNHDVLDMYHDEYMYLGCVQFVKQVKKGALSETSPMINDVSTVPTWAKVNSGMLKMYQVEVLSKLPIMQHFPFCSLLPFPANDAAREQQLPPSGAADGQPTTAAAVVAPTAISAGDDEAASGVAIVQ